MAWTTVDAVVGAYQSGDLKRSLALSVLESIGESPEDAETLLAEADDSGDEEEGE